MKTSDFDYYLPEELIAQTPVYPRDSSRLLVYDREKDKIEHKHFFDVVDYLKEGDVLVRNNTKVIPARLLGIKEITGAKCELLLLKQLHDDTWECLIKGAKKYYLQKFEDSCHCLQSGLNAVSLNTAKEYVSILSKNIPNTKLRGY